MFPTRWKDIGPLGCLLVLPYLFIFLGSLALVFYAGYWYAKH
jgi:hypothetical protein